ARCPSVSLPALRAPPQSSPARASSAVQEIPCPPPAPNIPVCTRQSRSTRETSFRSPPRHAQNPSPTPGSLPSPPASQNPLAANVSVSSAESAIPLPGTPDTPACGSPEFLLPPASTATSGIPTSVPLAPLPPSSFATPHRSAGSHIGSSTPPLPSARRSAAGSPESGSTASAQPAHFLLALYELHPFFSITAFSISLSRLKSATSFFNRPFSSSSCRNRCASPTLIPPYFAFHAYTVCFDTPNSRPPSAADRPASICFNAPIISTSLYFLFAMLPPSTICDFHIYLCAENGVKVTYGNGSDITSFTGIASDGSGYTFQVSNYTQLQVFSADGWLVYDNTGANGFNWPMDPNGNYIQYATGGMPDTLNRSPFQIGFYYCAGLNSYTNTVRSSDGSLATYTMTCSSQSVSQIVSGTQRAALKSFLTAITLPDGTSYSFTYDTGASGTHLGGLTSVTLPAGGRRIFKKVPGIPSLAVGAINLPGRTATVSAGGGTWDLSYALNQTNQIVTTVVAPPRFDVASNSTVQDKSVFTSVPFNPYLQTAQYYSGSTALLRTVTYAYDASGNFLPVTVTTTLNDTGQSSSVSYQYFNQMRNYPTQKQETGFSGSVARTTTTTYGPNMRPTAVNIYSGTAAGPLIASTLFTYDEYSANYCKNGVPGLTVVTGVTGHKDGVGPSGNPTTVSRWISGTSYATSHACYDSLGNVTQLVDANGNPTTFDYSENWADTSCIPAGTNTHAFP